MLLDSIPSVAVVRWSGGVADRTASCERCACARISPDGDDDDDDENDEDAGKR